MARPKKPWYSVNGTVQRKPTSLHINQKRQPKFQRMANNDVTKCCCISSFLYFTLARKFALSKAKVKLNNVVLPFSVVS